MKAIRMPIASCAHCWSTASIVNFTMPEWRRLELVETRKADHGGPLEIRKCDVCGGSIAVDMLAAADFDLFVPAEQYYNWFPDSPRVAEEVPRVQVAAKAGRSAGVIARGVVEWWKRRRRRGP